MIRDKCTLAEYEAFAKVISLVVKGRDPSFEKQVRVISQVHTKFETHAT